MNHIDISRKFTEEECKMMNSNKFELEVIASGDFLDSDPSFKGKVYQVATRTIRLNPIALNAYYMSRESDTIYDYDSRNEYEACKENKRVKRLAFEKQIAEILGFDPEISHVNIQQIVSEVFGVVYITVKE